MILILSSSSDMNLLQTLVRFSVLFNNNKANSSSATRNFDLQVTLKDSAVGSGEAKEYIFMSIDRSEYASLFDYIKSKEIPIKNPQEVRIELYIRFKAHITPSF
jgi:hypothetical protein